MEVPVFDFSFFSFFSGGRGGGGLVDICFKIINDVG